tara:strand:- start:1160 stop:2290 length:1131 start_codon:yes stop_codon:yes gene_type:complete
MKILIITPYAEPEKGACVVRVNGFRDYFKEQLNYVSVYAPERKGIRQSAQIKRYSGITELMKLVIKSDSEAIIGTSPPITHNFFALIAAKLTGKKFILDAKDPFTEIIKKLEPERTKSPKFLFFQIIEYLTHKLSDKIIFLNKPYLEDAVKKFSLKREKLILAPNGSDTQKIYFSEKERKETRKKLGIKNEFTLFYVGGTGDKDLTGFMEKSLKEIAEKQDIRMIFILSFTGSEGEKKIISELKNSAKKNNLEKNINFVFNVDFKELYKYLSAADAGLVAYPDFEMHVIGAKVFDYIAAGLPIASKASKGNKIQKEFIELNKIGFQSSTWEEFNRSFSKFAVKKYSRKEIVKVAEKNSRKNTGKKVLEEIKGLVKK